MASQPKKKDFFNGGKGVNPSDFETEGSVSPPTSPRNPEPPPLLDFGGAISPRVHEFPQSLSAPSSPPPMYPLPTPYGLYSPPYASHNPYLSPPMCPSTAAAAAAAAAAYPIPGMSYGSLEVGVGAAQGATGIASTAFPEAHLARNYIPHATYPAECWAGPSTEKESRSKSREREGHQQEKESTTTRHQKCSLCFNHGIIKEKKGHKWQCAFKNCECQRCLITKGRQKTMRDQQKLTRHLQKMQL